MVLTTSAQARFVRDHTELTAPALVPEVLLHLGSGIVELWEGVEAHVGRTGTEPPFWACAWAGGQVLARYLLDFPHLVAGAAVLDVATGSGLVAIAAARAGAASVRACDVDPLAVAAARVNVAANGVAVQVDVADATADAVAVDGWGAQVVLAGDVFYQRHMAEAMMACLERAAARGATVLVGDPGRAHLPTGRLEAAFSCDVPGLAEVEDAGTRRATVWRVPAPAAGAR